MSFYYRSFNSYFATHAFAGACTNAAARESEAPIVSRDMRA